MDIQNGGYKLKQFVYERLYQRLYDLGYHRMDKNHGVFYAEKIRDKYQKNIRKYLEIGCSQGLAVQVFKHSRHIKAYGIDCAMIATKYACQLEIPNILLGNVLDIPFKNDWFDHMFTCDVLEHLQKPDVNHAMQEMYRVGRQGCLYFIKVSDKLEQNTEWVEKYEKQFEPIPGGNLHLTVMSIPDWIKTFQHNGFKFIEEWEGMLVFQKC
jgi:ubiquinone/menaquinone biosynthesis C-methylase UbiE